MHHFASTWFPQAPRAAYDGYPDAQRRCASPSRAGMHRALARLVSRRGRAPSTRLLPALVCVLQLQGTMSSTTPSPASIPAPLAGREPDRRCAPLRRAPLPRARSLVALASLALSFGCGGDDTKIDDGAAGAAGQVGGGGSSGNGNGGSSGSGTAGNAGNGGSSGAGGGGNVPA